MNAPRFSYYSSSSALGVAPYLRRAAPMTTSPMQLTMPEARKIFPPRYRSEAAKWSGAHARPPLQSSSSKPANSTMRAAITDSATAAAAGPVASSYRRSRVAIALLHRSSAGTKSRHDNGNRTAGMRGALTSATTTAPSPTTVTAAASQIRIRATREESRDGALTACAAGRLLDVMSPSSCCFHVRDECASVHPRSSSDRFDCSACGAIIHFPTAENTAPR